MQFELEQIGEASDDVQSQTIAVLRAGGGNVDLVVLFKYMRNLIR
jgi:hypothetical protein